MSSSATTLAWTTSAALPTVFPSPAWPPHRQQLKIHVLESRRFLIAACAASTAAIPAVSSSATTLAWTTSAALPTVFPSPAWPPHRQQLKIHVLESRRFLIAACAGEHGGDPQSVEFCHNVGWTTSAALFNCCPTVFPSPAWPPHGQQLKIHVLNHVDF